MEENNENNTSSEVISEAYRLTTAIPNKVLNKDGSYSTWEDILGGSQVNLQEKDVEITENGEYAIEPDEGYNGLSSVNVSVDMPSNNCNLDVSNRKGGLASQAIGRFLSYINLDVNNADISLEKVCDNNYNITQAIFKNCKNVTSFSYAFQLCRNLEYIEIDDMTNNTSLQSAFYYCDKLTSINLKNTSNCNNFIGTFTNCTNLENINQLDMSSASATGGHVVTSLVASCSKLTNESIENILKSLLTIPDDLTFTRRLSTTGFNTTQREYIITLPEWPELEAKGWLNT